MAGIRIGGVADVFVCSPPWTAYGGAGTSGDPQVYVACSTDPPGTATQYTDFSGFVDSDQNHNPVVSPDGTKVLFQVLGASSGFDEIWVVDTVAGSTPTPVVASGSNYSFHPFWGPDSDTFLYVQGTGGSTSNGNVYKDIVSSPGSPTLLKTSPGGTVGAFRPQFNFDGTRVAYVWTASLDTQIRCMDDDGSNDGLVDNNISGYDSNEPPQFCWANTQNLISYQDGMTPQDVFVIDDTGGGKVQINANGAAAGSSALVSGRAWPADDSFVVITANIGSGYYTVFRAELDGSNTTVLGTTGASTFSYLRGALVYQGRIWFISNTSPTTVSFMSLTGTDETVVFDASDGSGDQVSDLFGGDGWYFN